MKRVLKRVIVVSLAIVACLAILNINVTTKQGIDYRVSIKKVPLYLKMLNFYDRHFNYKSLVQRIVDRSDTKEEKVLKILKWTVANISTQPPQLKVIDDHVWYIIVRRYGIDEQIQDVFSTLCNYVGADAFFERIRSGEKSRVFSFVMIEGEWRIFDAANGVYFVNEKGELADVKDLIGGNWKALAIKDIPSSIDYQSLFIGLNEVNYHDWQYSRSNLQTPIKRLIFGLNKK